MTVETLLDRLNTTKSNLKTAIQNAYDVNLSNVTFEDYHTYIKKVTCPNYITPYITITYDSTVYYENKKVNYIYFTWSTNCPVRIDGVWMWRELCWVNADTGEEYSEIDDDAQGEYVLHKCNNRGTINLYLKWKSDKVTVISNTVTVTDV